MKLLVWAFCILTLCSSPLHSKEKEALPLREAFARALKLSETVGIREEEIRIAEAHYLQAWGTALPQIAVKGTEFLQDTTADTTFSSSFTRRSKPEVAVTLSQPIFQGLSEYQALRVAGAEKSRNRLEKRRAQELLFLDVTKTYYTILELEHQAALQDSLLGVMDQRMAEIRDRIRLGKSRDSERLVAEAQKAALAADRDKTEGQLQNAREALAFLTGASSTVPLEDAFEVPPMMPPVEKSLEALSRRADLRASDEAVRLAQGRVRYEQGGHLPQVGLNANYYPYRTGFQEDIKWDMLFTATLPLFQGGATEGRVKEAKALLKQTELTAVLKKRGAERDLKQAYVSLVMARERETSLREASRKSGDNYQAQVSEYRLGLVNNLDVLQSLRDWQQLCLDYNLSHYQTKLEFLNLKVAEGHLPIVEDLLLQP